MAWWKKLVVALFGRKKEKKVKVEQQKPKTVDASTQYQRQPTAAVVKQRKMSPRELLSSLERESMLMEFFERRGVSWPSKERLPWTVKMNNLYPDLSEFL